MENKEGKELLKKKPWKFIILKIYPPDLLSL